MASSGGMTSAAIISLRRLYFTVGILTGIWHFPRCFRRKLLIAALVMPGESSEECGSGNHGGES